MRDGRCGKRHALFLEGADREAEALVGTDGPVHACRKNRDAWGWGRAVRGGA